MEEAPCGTARQLFPVKPLFRGVIPIPARIVIQLIGLVRVLLVSSLTAACNVRDGLTL